MLKEPRRSDYFTEDEYQEALDRYYDAESDREEAARERYYEEKHL